MKAANNTWICNKCEKKFKITGGGNAAFCPFCGGNDLVAEVAIQRMKTYAQYDAELDEITSKMNDIMAQFKPLHDRYYEIMMYWRTQKSRKLITDDEYEMRANKYRYRVLTTDGKRVGRKPSNIAIGDRNNG